ncbi:MAG: putative 4-mercaptohistidine N1-methyltransferase [Luteolibacter sp.]|uniref:putative 4-mercaptohistidine N1-methyltransferase n=1 Tax=Luteolibacter sp. TaxID=1962973 RepID=UPI0032631951
MSDIYETDKLLAEYLLFHFGTADEMLPPGRSWPQGMREALDFAKRTPGHFSPHNVKRGLDLGCAVGRSAFEMSRTCDEVVGIDFSHAFIRAADALRNGETLAYERREEAALTTPLTTRLTDGCDGAKLRFLQGDAMDLPDSLGSFDRVHAANLLCRLPDPARLLGRLPSLVNPGGELVLATPCTWLEEFTPSSNWPVGGTFEWLRSKLAPDFELLRHLDEPFLIRETARKFQWTTSLVTVWQRVG